MPGTAKRWFPTLAILCLLVVQGVGSARLLAEPTGKPVAQQVRLLARTGKLAQVIHTMLAEPAGRQESADLALLKQRVLRYQQHLDEQKQQNARAFDKAMAEMHEHLEAGDLTEALGSAVEASGLAEQPQAFLRRPEIEQLVRKAEQAASAYQTKHQWLEALALYRRLDLLFDDHDRYKKPIKQIASHLRTLRLFAPDLWHEMNKAYAKAHDKAEPVRWNDPEHTWRQELEGISPTMLRYALSYAVREHVEPTTYEQLLRGGLDELRSMLKTRGLEQTFPSLGDPKKVKAFWQALDGLSGKLAQPAAPMGYPQASALVREVFEANSRTVNLPVEVVTYEMTEGALGTLDDFTAMIWPSQKKRFERTTKQRFTGVGVQISLVNDELTVVTPLSGTPAHRAGLKPGDRIVTINGKPTTGITLEDAVTNITGPEGTTVQLGIQSPGSDTTRVVTLTRQTIHIVSVKGFERKSNGQWDFYVDRQHRIGLIRLEQFGPDSAAEMDKAVEQMRLDAGLRGLILDLRYNPGGLLGAAVDVANRFLDEGVIVSGVKPGHQSGGLFGLGDSRTWRKRADSRHTYGDFPVIVLINKGSASASEIVAGALQAHRRALILGERSYGKGSVQEIKGIVVDPATLEAKAQLKLTTQYYQLPNGRIIHRRPGAATWGIEPDVHVRMTDRQIARQIKSRLLLDILRDGGQDRVEADTVIGSDEDGDEEPLPELTCARQLLEYGLDPQLESAVLLLQAQLLSDGTLADSNPAQ